MGIRFVEKEKPVEIPTDRREREAILEAAAAGDAAVMPQVRTILDKHQSLKLNWGYQARNNLFGCIAGEKQPLLREMLERESEQLLQELQGKNPSPLVRIVSEQIVFSWLETCSIQASDGYLRGSGEGLEMILFWQKRLSIVQGRLMRAVKTLAQIKRLEAVSPLPLALPAPDRTDALAQPDAATSLPPAGDWNGFTEERRKETAGDAASLIEEGRVEMGQITRQEWTAAGRGDRGWPRG